jgi:putative transposase
MVEILHSTLLIVKELYPFTMLGYVFLPDHFHILIQPTGESNFSQIIHSVKPNFTKTYKRFTDESESMKFWQKRFWDHVIRAEHDLENHLHYIYSNSVKHGLVADLRDWPECSYRE